MKKTLQILAIVLFGFTLQAQETISLSMGSGYADRVFYKLADGSTHSYVNDEWDIAFYRGSNFEFATRINDGKGIKVYEASNNPADWETINIADIGNWTTLYNSDTEWNTGAFDNGTATYGWGEYNSVTHHVEGTVIFVLEYADGTYRKFFIEDFFGGYTFKYATWNGTAWSTDSNYVLGNTTNPDRLFNYFSLENNAEVIAEPAADAWDVVFTKYITDLGGGMMYSVTGVLHHPNVTVAKHDETTGTPDPEDLEFLEAINTIGYDWKTFNGSTFVIDSDTGYYVQTANDGVYKIIFTGFEGSSTGNLSFTLEPMGNLSTIDPLSGNMFILYPNPATTSHVQLSWNTHLEKEATITIYNAMGSKVKETVIKSDVQRSLLSLEGLSSGLYLVEVQSGTHKAVQKLVVK